MARIMLEGVAIGALIAMCVVLLVYWPELPAKIPAHFNAAGHPDGWGGRKTLLILPAVSLGCYLLMSVIPCNRNSINLPFSVREENWDRQIELVSELLLWLKAALTLLFAYISWASIRVSLGQADGLGAWFLPLTLTTIFGTIAVYFWRAWRAR